MGKSNFKNYLKFAGNILTIVALVFIIKKIFNMEMDFSIFLSSKNIFIFSGLVCLNIFLMLVSYIPWITIVTILSNQKISIRTSMLIFLKSNILKYIPGNVLQYIGRNELALRTEIKHIDVAIATIIDVFLLIFAVILLSIFLIGGNAIGQLMLNRGSFFKYLFIVLCLLIFIGFIFFFKFKERITGDLERYIKIINFKNLLRLLLCIAFYIIYLVFFAGIYIVILEFMLKQQMDFKLLLNLAGAFNLSWLIGFITPGAPGGIGIREAGMTLIAGGLIDGEAIILSMVIFRLINILSDFGAFLAVSMFNTYCSTQSDQ